MSGRDRILARVRSALEDRGASEHPGPFESWGAGEGSGDLLDAFTRRFRAAGGEVVVVPDRTAAAEWLRAFGTEFGSVTFGRGVPPALRWSAPTASPETAELGVSVARRAVAETGSLMLDARDGRRSQLLVPNHVVAVEIDALYPTLDGALRSVRGDLPSALGLHSGPSKSADIGQVMVTGVHGPGRVIAVVVSGSEVRAE